jgi:aminoglycoside 6'-N-acetyltransferase
VRALSGSSVDFHFRRLEVADLRLLHEWLNEPGVVRWWEGQDVSWEALQRSYTPTADDWREQWLALLDDQPVGWLQCYRAVDNPDETEDWWDLGVHPDAAGIDYLLANPTQRRRGVGSRMIRAFALDVVLALHPDWTQVCAGPFEANAASWRALEKAGFRCVGVTDDDEGPCRLMVLDRSN